jgi:hypothetical protein
MALDEIQHGEVALGIADNGRVFLQLQEAVEAIVVLEGFELQFAAFLGGEPEAGFVAAIARQMLVKFGAEKLVKGGVTQGTLAIGLRRSSGARPNRPGAGSSRRRRGR